MPVDQILAPFYAKVFYKAGTLPLHQYRLYFDTVPSYPVGGAKFDSYTDGTHTTGWTLAEIIAEIDDRLQAATSQYAGYTIQRVERWESADGANVFRGFDDGTYTGITGGVGANIASATYRYTFQTNLRRNFSLGFIDMADAKPQTTAVPQPPTADDGFLPWFILRSAVRFTNTDGVRLTRVVNSITGYNRYAARKYGKNIVP